MEPLSVDDRTDRVVVEVMLCASVLLTDHIDVALQDELDTIFVAWGSRLTHDDVAYMVLLVLDAMLLGELLQIGDDLAFLLGGAGDLCDLMEVLPHDLRVQLCDFHCLLDVYV